jgi:hypothetical protein
MGEAARIASLFLYRVRRVKVIALVGRSGTGKSFRARLVAEKRGIDVIIDDGLVIRDDTIISGHWAKKEGPVLASIRKALFGEEELAREARASLRSKPFHSVLIVGTSARMVNKIVKNLWLPAVSETLSVEDIATRGEIEKAMRRRTARSSHASPLPVVRVRRRPLRRLLSAAAGLFRPTRLRARIESPGNDPRGSVLFSESALIQIVIHFVKELAPHIEVIGVKLWDEGEMLEIEISLRAPPDRDYAGDLHALRESVLHGVEKYTGLLVREVRVIVQEIEPVP